MKAIKNIISLMMIALIATACNDDGGDSNMNLTEGGLPKITIDDSKSQFIDNESPELTEIGFTVDKGTANIKTMDVVLYYVSENAVNRIILDNNVSDFPKSYTITGSEIINLFQNLESSEDLIVGDQLVITADVTLNNGSVIRIFNDDLSRNFGTEIGNSNLFKPSQSITVSCASYLEGTYDYSTINLHYGGRTLPGPYTGTVDLSPFKNGEYNISDGSFGFFGNFSNDSPARGVTLVDVCDKIKLGGKDQYGESYKMSNLQVNGPSITFDWINSYGEGATTTLTRTDGTDWPALILN